MKKITIHRGLTELKTLDARIDKEINGLNACTAMIEADSMTKDRVDVEVFEKDAKRRYQKITDLMTYRAKIKSAIVKANATVEVTIGDKTMTIADAINLKAVIDTKTILANTLRKSHKHAKKIVEEHNVELDKHALQLVRTVDREAESLDEVTSESKGFNMMNDYKKANTFSVSDPLDATILADKLDEEVTVFKGDIDATLSEINAITEIEVEE